MKIALIVNTRKDENEFQVEYDPPHTIEQIQHGIEAAGYEYVFIEGDENVIENLKKEKPDLVFNRSEGLRGESRESHVPAILEMLSIPYIGSGPKTLALCLDKAWTKIFAAAHGVKTPGYALITSMEEADKYQPLFPVILKPNVEGSSIGINEDNVVYDRESYLAKIESMLAVYHQPILVEKFIDGQEFSVGVLVHSAADIEIFPILEVDFSKMPSKTGNVFGQIAKTVYDDLENYICPTNMEEELKKALTGETEKICKSLEIRDFARLDFRVDSEGCPWFLEINPLPGMDYDESTKDFSFYTLMAFKAGYNYDSLIASLIESAMKYYSL